jgi:hypothetical protein
LTAIRIPIESSSQKLAEALAAQTNGDGDDDHGGDCGHGNPDPGNGNPDPSQGSPATSQGNQPPGQAGPAPSHGNPTPSHGSTHQG